MPAISVRTLPWRQWPTLASTWEHIHDRCPEASFFLSREWVDCWLATFGEDLQPDLLLFERNGETVGCCLLVWRRQRVRGIPMRRVYLNCAGEDESDSTCIEYNTLLAVPKHADLVAGALIDYLRTRPWDEFILQGMADNTPISRAAAALGTSDVSTRSSYHVALPSIRGEAGGFDAVLSSNTRQKIRRCQRLYEEAHGPCTFRVARSREEADAMLARLADLHQAAWHDRGLPGVFASERFTGFHRRLVEATFARNRIFLLEALAGAEPIGAVYSFVFRGTLSFYQSGFRYSTDGRLKPGLLTHYFAVRHCLEATDLEEYDFLAGDGQYKRSLATDHRLLHWIVVRRSTVPSLLFRALRHVKRKYAALSS